MGRSRDLDNSSSSGQSSSLFSEEDISPTEEEWDEYLRENFPHYDSWLRRSPRTNPAMAYRWSVTFKLLCICIVVHFGFFMGQFIVQSTSFAFEMASADGMDLVFIETTFNVWTSITQAWRDAKTYHDKNMYTIAIVVFVTSVIVPHLKLILAMTLWLYPDLSHATRRNWTKALDAVGRWNHFDVILCNYLVAMCKYKSEISTIIVMQTYVYIMSGLYWYCVGVVVSQLIGNYVILKLYSLEDAEEGRDGRPVVKSLRDERYTLSREARQGYMDGGWRGGFMAMVMFFLPLLMLFNFLVYIVAIYSYAFKVDVRVPRYFAPCEERMYSVMSTTWMLLSNDSIPMARQHDLLFKAGEWFVGALVLVFLFFAPMLRITVQFVMWFIPMSKESHILCQRVHEVSMDWSCLDVSLWAAFMSFTMSKSVTETYLPCRDCFAILITPITGFYLCIVSVLLSYLTNYLVLKAIEKVEGPRPEETMPLIEPLNYSNGGSKKSSQRKPGYCTSCGTQCLCPGCAARNQGDGREQGGAVDADAFPVSQEAAGRHSDRHSKSGRRTERSSRSGDGSRRSRSSRDDDYNYPGTVPRPSPRL